MVPRLLLKQSFSPVAQLIYIVAHISIVLYRVRVLVYMIVLWDQEIISKLSNLKSDEQLAPENVAVCAPEIIPLVLVS